MQAFLSVLAFLAQNKDTIKQIILLIQELFGSGTGATKAAVFKQWLASAMQAEEQVEQAWPLISPIFNAVVALVKNKA